MRSYRFELQQQYLVNVDFSINSGQVFLWEKNEDAWYGINGADVLAVNENPFQLNSYSQKSCDFFREKDDFEEIIRNITKDKVVGKAVEEFPGLRLLRQDPFQCYISFIVSSNSNIQRIKQILYRLCKKFGKKIIFQEKEFYLFPEPENLANASKNDLLNCGLGYRARAVKEAALNVSNRQIDFDFLKRTNYQNAKDILLQVYGIGNKVADCVLLFSLEKLEAFPLDRWVLRILEKYYTKKFQLEGKSLTEKKYEQIHKQIVNYFGPYAGYSQQFLFKMERELNQKRWL